MTNKTKKILALSGCSIACMALIIAISLQFFNPEPADDALGSGQNAESNLSINIPETGEDSASTLPDQTDQPEQIIQGDPAKPEATQEQLTDPTTKPDGEKVEGTPESTDHNNVSKPATQAPASSDAPQGGEKKDGMIYVPGFGWIKDEGGGGSGTTVGNPDDELTGNKVGSMD